MGPPLWTGVFLGAMVGLVNERLTRLCLEGALLNRLASWRFAIRWLTVGFYATKFGLLWVLVYLLLSRLHLSLLGFALGILAYQLYRFALMIFWPRIYLGQRYSQ